MSLHQQGNRSTSRASMIEGCSEAKGREVLATHLAFNTDMSIDAAKAILRAAPSDPTDRVVANYKLLNGKA